MTLDTVLTIALLEDADIIRARRHAREIASLLGFSAQDQTRIATAVSEIARNAATYGRGGRVEFAAVQAPWSGLRVVVRDSGPGIAGVDRALSTLAGSTASMGVGLSSTRRLMDEFTIESDETGTVVTFGKTLPAGAPPITPARIADIGVTLAVRKAADVDAEVRLQNRELLESLAALTAKQEESERLNEELAATNRGVVALYAELDEKAAQLAALNAGLEGRVASAVADYQAVNDALRQSQKMEAVGQLTGGIAHDFNNLLQIVVGNLELVLRRLPEDQARIRRAVNNAMLGAQRAATLTQRLLAFSRRQPLQPKPLELNALVQGMSDLMRRTLGEDVRIETALADALWVVEVDANQLENALLNLAVNARDAMPMGGTLTIGTANGVMDSLDAGFETSPGDYVVLTVSDTGTGMSQATMARVFEPFFTTKEAGKGTGLGLSMVYGFVKQSGGHLQVESELGQGTRLTLFLPRYDGAPTGDTVASADPAELARPEETVLVVEDDADVRAYSCDVLGELGYTVLVAPDGLTAVSMLEGGERIDLVFTDIVLAGSMNGRAVAERAAVLRPGVPVLFASGHAHEAPGGDRSADFGETVDFLAKPFSYSTLAKRVRGAIARGT
ncbi:MAG: ATP-binding protein [Janthinobacterium lividum]